MMSLLTLCNDCGRCQTAIDGLQNGMVDWRRWKSSCPSTADDRSGAWNTGRQVEIENYGSWWLQTIQGRVVCVSLSSH